MTARTGFPKKQATLLASLLRVVATYTSDDQTADGRKGVILYIDVTAQNGTSVVAVKLQGKDPVTGNWVDIAGAVTAALSALTTTTLTLYPGVGEAANVLISDVLPPIWRISATVTNATSLTFSVGADLIA